MDYSADRNLVWNTKSFGYIESISVNTEKEDPPT